jgi:O-antigen/teichoic acid export membrane protein
MRWLAPLPLLKGIQYFGANALTGGGHQGVRSGLQALVAIFNVLINLWLIPAYSWRGAAWSSLASDGLLTLLLWLAIWYLARHAGTAPPAVALSARSVQRTSQ